MQFFLKKNLWHRCFPVSFAKFLKTPFSTEYLRWQLLNIIMKILWLQYGYLLRSFSNTFRIVRYQIVYASSFSKKKRPFSVSRIEFFSEKNNELEFNAVSVCVNFQRRFFLRGHWKLLPVPKPQTRKTLSKVWNLFKLTIRKLLTLFWCPCYQLWTDFTSFCCVFIIDFDQEKLYPAGIYRIKLTM